MTHPAAPGNQLPNSLGPHHVPTPRPYESDPSQLVENVYPVPGPLPALRDYEGQAVMTRYLADRFVDDSILSFVQVGSVPVGPALPKPVREVVGTKPATHSYHVGTGEYVGGYTPKIAWAVTAGSIVVSGLGFNYDAIGTAASNIYKHADAWIESIYSESPHHTVTVPAKPETIEVDAAAASKIGVSEVDPKAVKTFVMKIEDAEKEGKVVQKIVVDGGTSDEWGAVGDPSIATEDPNNRALTHTRTSETAKGVNAQLAATGSKLRVTDTRDTQYVISKDEKKFLEKTVKSDHYGSITDAIKAADHGEKVKPSLLKKLKEHFINNRGAKLEASIVDPGQATTEDVKEHDQWPNTPYKKPRLFPFIPPVWWERKRKVSETYDKDVKKWRWVPGMQMRKPEIMFRNPFKPWVRLRPEILQADGTLGDYPWAYSGKYEHLMRDNRIYEMMRADFENSEGEARSIRLMFVDHNPGEEVKEHFAGILENLAALQDGRVGEKITGMFVYPSRNTGRQHGDPKRIGLGYDKQMPADVLGVCTPILESVEMHMQDTWNPDEIDAMFADWLGPGWTLAHEAGGHGTHIADQKQTLRRARFFGIPNAYVTRGNNTHPNVDRLKKLGLKRLTLPLTGQLDTSKKHFDVTVRTQDLSDVAREHTFNRIPDSDEQVLPIAHHTHINGWQNTHYGGTNKREHWAETAANAITGLPVPYDQAGVVVPDGIDDNRQAGSYATGYSADWRALNTYYSEVGATSGEFPIQFRNAPRVRMVNTIIENDRLREQMVRARVQPVLRPEEKIAIVATSYATKAPRTHKKTA